MQVLRVEEIPKGLRKGEVAARKGWSTLVTWELASPAQHSLRKSSLASRRNAATLQRVLE